MVPVDRQYKTGLGLLVVVACLWVGSSELIQVRAPPPPASLTPLLGTPLAQPPPMHLVPRRERAHPTRV